MPIEIQTLPGNPVAIGWGVDLSVRSDFVGPLPADASWQLEVFNGESESYTVVTQGHASQLNPDVIHVGSATDITTFGHGVAQDGDQLLVLVRLQSASSGILDQSTVTLPWTTSSSDVPAIIEHTGGGTDSGLTPTQAQQLEQTHQSTWPAINLDPLTLTELTDGPQGGFVGAQLPSVVFGVIIRIADVPPALTPGTPDGDYWTPSLAVVRLYRGSDLWLRVPVHTSSKIIPFASENLVVAVAESTLFDWLLNLSLQVFFREGVTGQVFLMRFP